MQIKEAILSGGARKGTSPWDVLITGAMLETEPNWVIQIGTKSKFSVLYSANLLERIGGERRSVLSIVKDATSLPQKKNVCYLEGDPLDLPVLAAIRKRIRPEDKVMVILEDGLKPHPIVEIQTYAPWVTEGCYLVMGEAIDAFALKYVEFEPDWMMTKPQLYLRTATGPDRRSDDLLESWTRMKYA